MFLMSTQHPEESDLFSENPDPSVPGEIDSDRDLLPQENSSHLKSLFLFSFLCILAVLLILFAIRQNRSEVSITDLLELSAEVARDLEIAEPITESDQAQAYIRTEFGWRVGVPLIEDIPLVGMSIVDLAPAVGVPAFIYENPEQRIVVLSLNYALLDDVPDRIRISPEDNEALIDGRPHLTTLDNQDVVIWRHRDDIYIAVPDFPAESLIGSISMAGNGS